LLVDATGRSGVAEPVRSRLAQLGWTVPRSATTEAVQQRSEIQYAPANEAVAKALARTLSRQIVLAACSDGCAGVKLVLGADAIRWDQNHSPG